MGVPEADCFLHEHPGRDPHSVAREGADCAPGPPCSGPALPWAHLTFPNQLL